MIKSFNFKSPAQMHLSFHQGGGKSFVFGDFLFYTVLSDSTPYSACICSGINSNRLSELASKGGYLTRSRLTFGVKRWYKKVPALLTT